MRLHVIPYVADQFEPGVYVFEGESYSGSLLLQNSSPDLTVLDIKKQTFNTSNILLNGINPGYYAFDVQKKASFKFFEGKFVIVLEGLEVDVSHSFIPITQFVFNVLNWDSSISFEGANTTEYTDFVYGQIQNSIFGVPVSRPRIIGSPYPEKRDLAKVFDLVVRNFDDAGISTEANIDSVTLTGTSNSVLSAYSDMTSTTKSSPVPDEIHFSVQPTISTVVPAPIVAVVTLSVGWTESVSNAPSFSM